MTFQDDIKHKKKIRKSSIYAGAIAGLLFWTLFTAVDFAVYLFARLTGTDYAGGLFDLREFLLYLSLGAVYGGLYSYLPGKRSTTKAIGLVFVGLLIAIVWVGMAFEFTGEGAGFILAMLFGVVLSGIVVGAILGGFYDIVIVKAGWYPRDKDKYLKDLVSMLKEIKRGGWFEKLSKNILALLFLVTLGAYIYLQRRPWSMVPYLLIGLGVAWWLYITLRFRATYEVAELTYVLPVLLLTIYLTLLPSMSIVLRGYMGLSQTLNISFLAMVGFVIVTERYYWLVWKINERNLKKGRED